MHALLLSFVLLFPQARSEAGVAHARALELWHEQGDYNGALQAFNEAVAASPNDLEVRFGRAGFYYAIFEVSTGDQRTTFRDLAEKEFGFICARAPDSIKAGISRDVLRLLRGEVLFEEPRLDCPEFEGRFAEANKLWTTRDHEPALEGFREVALGCPDDAVAQWALADAYFVMGDYESAVESFRRAIELRPWYASAHRFQGDALARLGRGEEALEAYAMAVLSEPTYEAAWSALRSAAEGLERSFARAFEVRAKIEMDEACDGRIIVPTEETVPGMPEHATMAWVTYGTRKANSMASVCNGESQDTPFEIELLAVQSVLQVMSELREAEGPGELTRFWQMSEDAREAGLLEEGVHLHWLSKESLPEYLAYREQHGSELLSYLLELVVPAAAEAEASEG